MKLKKGDEITITAGKDRGKRGKIETIIPKKNRVLVAGMNIFKRHLKRRDEKNPGGIIDVSRPIPVANVAYICPKCHKSSRLAYVVSKAGKERICRKCKSVI